MIDVRPVVNATTSSNVATRIKLAELYSQALVGMVALTGRWWLEVRKPRKETVAAHLVNIAWNGLSHLDPKPSLTTRKGR